MQSLLRFALLFMIASMMVVAFSSRQTALAQAEDDVIINEFTVNSNVGREYVELLVTNPSGVNMQNWTISDTSTRAVAAGATEGDITLPAAAYLANVPQGTHVVIVLTTPIVNANILAEDTSTVDGNNRLVLIVGVTTGITTSGTMDNATADNIQVYAGTRAAGTLIDEVLVGTNTTSYIAGATWGDNNGATTADNVNAGAAVPSNCAVRFVPTANTLAGFQDNDTGVRFVVDANSYGTPGRRNAGVSSETALGNPAPFLLTADFDGDKKADVSVWRSDERNWYVYQSSLANQLKTVIDWGSGALGDIAVPGDYDGDGKTDFAVWRPSEGNWYILKSTTNLGTATGWGAPTDKPVPGDYDGDGKTDLAVFRSSEGNWYILNSSTSTMTIRNFGVSSDKLVQGDYDGDGKTDVAVYRPAEGNWYVLNSLTNTVSARSWGAAGDMLVPADYNSDGLADIAVFRPSENNWYILKSGGGVTIQNWGTSGDTPVPADYDGDGKADIAVYRPSEGNWYVINSSNSSITNSNLPGLVPVPNAYLPQ
jgi:hypothetical protein